MFRLLGGKKIFEIDISEAPKTNVDEVKTYFQKGSGAKDTYGPLFSAIPPISLSASKPISYDMDSGSVLTIKNPPLHNKI